MAQLSKVSGVATSISKHLDNTVISYHGTAVVQFNDETVTLQNCGWYTVTTKTRMNQASNQFNLGYYVFQKDYAWYVTLPSGETVAFSDPMTFERN